MGISLCFLLLFFISFLLLCYIYFISFFSFRVKENNIVYEFRVKCFFHVFQCSIPCVAGMKWTQFNNLNKCNNRSTPTSHDAHNQVRSWQNIFMKFQFPLLVMYVGDYALFSYGGCFFCSVRNLEATRTSDQQDAAQRASDEFLGKHSWRSRVVIIFGD